MSRPMTEMSDVVLLELIRAKPRSFTELLRLSSIPPACFRDLDEQLRSLRIKNHIYSDHRGCRSRWHIREEPTDA